MSHDGHHHHHHRASDNLKVAFLLNLGFTIFEIAGGIWTNSVAILSDAVHDAGDCLSLGLAWYLQRLAYKEADWQFSYGYRRLSSLGALVTGLVLIAGVSYIAWEAVWRLAEPQQVNAPGMVLIAIVGFLVNGAAAWRLYGARTLNEMMASWHLLEDTLGWGAILVGALIMSVWNMPIIDPIMSLAIAAFVLVNVFRNLKRVALVFLQAAPSGFDAESFDRQVANLPGVVSAHHTHTWTLDGESHVFSTHLVLREQSTRDEIIATKARVHELLREQHFVHITVEIELENEACAAESGGPMAEQCRE